MTGVPAELTTANDFVQVRLALLQHLGGALEAIVFSRIQYRTRDDSRAWIERNGRRWWTVSIPSLAAEMGHTEKQIRRVLDLLTKRGALVREHLNEGGPYDRRYSYSPVILDLPSRADGPPPRADVDVPSRADVDPPSGALLPLSKNREEGEITADALSPFCSNHPKGTEQPCRACGVARMSFEARRAAERSKPTPSPAAVGLERTCAEHPNYPLEVDGSCTRCTRDATDATPLRHLEAVA